MAHRWTPVAVGEVLRRSAKLEQGDRISWWTWHDLVGERVASRSSPDFLDGGTLVVTVKSSSWAQELSLLSPLILTRLKDLHSNVKALRFRVGELKLPERPPVVRAGKARALPAELVTRIERIEHEKLRAAVREAASFCIPPDDESRGPHE
jgi:hypothetical protein